MKNKFKELRDEFIEENPFWFKKADLEKLSTVMNYLISYPSLIDEIIKSWESENIEKDKKIVKLWYDLINEIKGNKKLVEELIKMKKSEKPWKPIQTYEYVDIYKKRMLEK